MWLWRIYLIIIWSFCFSNSLSHVYSRGKILCQKVQGILLSVALTIPIFYFIFCCCCLLPWKDLFYIFLSVALKRNFLIFLVFCPDKNDFFQVTADIQTLQLTVGQGILGCFSVGMVLNFAQITLPFWAVFVIVQMILKVKCSVYFGLFNASALVQVGHIMDIRYA